MDPNMESINLLAICGSIDPSVNSINMLILLCGNGKPGVEEVIFYVKKNKNIVCSKARD